MKKLYNKLTADSLFYIVIALLTLVFVVKTDVIYAPDSEGYLDMSIIRSSGYPLFIAAHKLLFGSYYISFLILSQFVLNLYAAFFLVKSLSKTLLLQKWHTYILFVIILVPLFYEKVANGILSEALAYPLYLLVVANLLLATLNKQFSNFYYACVLTFILILVRGQFLFLIPVLLAGIALNEPTFHLIKKYLILAFCIIAIPIAAIGTDILFHKIQHEHATTTPWTGVQIASLPFFVSSEEDYSIFENKDQQAYFKFIHKQLQQKKLLLNQLPKESLSPADYYSYNYVFIANSTLSEKGETFFDNHLSDAQRIILNDKMASSMAIPLIKINFIKWISLYFKNAAKGIGTIATFITFLLLILSSTIKKENNAKFIIIGSLLILGNIALVALAEPTLSRYVFYNHWILVAIILLLFQNTFLKKSHV